MMKKTDIEIIKEFKETLEIKKDIKEYLQKVKSLNEIKSIIFASEYENKFILLGYIDSFNRIYELPNGDNLLKANSDVNTQTQTLLDVLILELNSYIKNEE